MATTQVNLAEQVEGVLPIAEGGTGNATGAAQSAAVATKLATARTLQANLASTGTGSFDGSANTTLGVTGTLALANGGTGATTAAGVISNLGLATVATTGSYASLTGTPLFGLNPVFVSTTYTAKAADMVIVTAPTAAFTITLPAAPPNGTCVGIGRDQGGTTRVITISRGGSDTITESASTSVTLTEQSSLDFYFYESSVSQWQRLSVQQVAFAITNGALYDKGGPTYTYGTWMGPSSSLPASGTTGVLYICTS